MCNNLTGRRSCTRTTLPFPGLLPCSHKLYAPSIKSDCRRAAPRFGCWRSLAKAAAAEILRAGLEEARRRCQYLGGFLAAYGSWLRCFG